MNEDSLYRASTQYRFWSFTPNALKALREDTNHLAAARVQAAQAESQQSTSSTSVNSPSSGNVSEIEKNGAGTPKPSPAKPKAKAAKKPVEPITPAEELAVIKFYCEKILELGNEFTPPLPSSVRVRATSSPFLDLLQSPPDPLLDSTISPLPSSHPRTQEYHPLFFPHTPIHKMLKDLSPFFTTYDPRIPLFPPPLAISNEQIFSIQATAIQYLHRFYLSQSTMIHPPVLIMKCCLFFALKTDNFYLELDKFLSFLPGTTRSDILDQEYLLLRTLRYTMDVRHPFRGLEGGVMELMGWASGEGEAPPGSAKSPAELRRDLLAIEAIDGKGGKIRDMFTRIGIAATKAKDMLKSAAVLTDAYFLYTPSQIWLATLLLSDAPLFHFYLRSKFPSSSPHSSQSDDDTASSSSVDRLYAKVLRTIESCAALLQTYTSTSEEEFNKSLKSIGRKLHYIDKLWEKYPKHGTKREQEEEVEREKKKRKLEREKGEREGDVFGGPIGEKIVEKKDGGGGGEWSD